MESLSLPMNPDAENALIGLTILEKGIPQGARDIGIAEMYGDRNKAIWSAILEIEVDGKEVDPYTIMEIVKRDRRSLVDSGAVTIASLMETTYGMTLGFNENLFAAKLKDASTRRYAIRECNAAINALASGDPDAIKTLSSRIAAIESVSNARGNFRHISEIIEKEVLPGIEDLVKGVSHKIKTPWPALDRLIGGGITFSDIVLVAAPPGAGKSAFVLQLATWFARQGLGVGIIAGEMSDKENVYRLVSQAAHQYNLNSVDSLSAGGAEPYIEWAHDVKNLPIYFDSRTSDLQTVGRSLRYLVEECGVKVLVIDYVQLFKMSKFDKLSRYERISEVSQEVKRLAMEYGIAVFEVAQFTKEGMKSDKAKLTDLENGTQLIKDISIGIILDWLNSKEVALRIEKGRNAGRSEIRGQFIGHQLRFEF